MTIPRCPHDAPWFACRLCATDVPPAPDPEPVTGTTRLGWLPVVAVIVLALAVTAWRLVNG